MENVIKGNEKVLVARLEDGEFFWREDQKLVISDLVEKLNNVTFHEKIGSLREHMIRTGQIAIPWSSSNSPTIPVTSQTCKWLLHGLGQSFHPLTNQLFLPRE